MFVIRFSICSSRCINIQQRNLENCQRMDPFFYYSTIVCYLKLKCLLTISKEYWLNVKEIPLKNAWNVRYRNLSKESQCKPTLLLSLPIDKPKQFLSKQLSLFLSLFSHASSHHLVISTIEFKAPKGLEEKLIDGKASKSETTYFPSKTPARGFYTNTG